MRLVGVISVALLLAGILAVPTVMALTQAECVALGYTDGTTESYSSCTSDAGCQKDWTCILPPNEKKIYDANDNSACMDNNKCCWDWDYLMDCPGGANCQRPSIPTVDDPYNRVSAWCGCTFTVTITPVINDADVTFTATPNDCSLDTTDLSSYTYLWVFGDGTLTVTTQSPTHTYAADGDYTVTLTLTDAAPDSDIVIKTHPVSISGAGGPPAEFTVTLTHSPSSPAPGDTVTFTAKAGGGTTACRPYKYSWEYSDEPSAGYGGDGGSGDPGTMEEYSNIIHTYSEAGTYTLDVTVKSCDETETATATATVTVSEGGEEPTETPDISGAGLTCDPGDLPADFQKLILTTLCVIWRIIQGIVAILAALVVAIAGLRYLSTDNPEQRDKARKMIASVVVAAVIIVVALQFANFMISETVAWNEFDCAAYGGGDDIMANVVDVACILFTIIQLIAAVIALVVIALAGVRWSTSDAPEGRAQAKSMIYGAIVGLIIVFIATNFVKAIFFGDDNALMGDFSCSIADDKVEAIQAQVEDFGCVLFLAILFPAGTLVALVIVLAGIKWMSSESPADRDTAKRWFIHALIGLVIVMVASQLIWAMTSVAFSFDFSGLFGDLGDLFDFGDGFGGFFGDLFDIGEDIFGTPYLVMCIAKTILHGSVWLLIAQLHVMFCIFVRSMQAVAAAVAALYLTITGLRLVGTDDPETRTEAKRKIYHVLVGFMITLVALSIVDMISVINWFVNWIGGILGDIPLIGGLFPDDFYLPFSELTCPSFFDLGGEYFVNQLQYIFCILIRIIQLIAVIVAGLVIMLSGIKWSASDDLESRTEAKTRIIYALLGLVVIILALDLVHVLMGGDVGLEDLSPLSACQSATTGADIDEKSRYLGCIFVRILQASAALISGLVIALAGVRWMSTDTPEDKSNAKNFVIHALVGLAIVIIALQLVNTLVGGTVDITDFTPSCSVPEDLKDSIWAIGCNLIKILQFVAGILGTLVIIVGGLIWVGSGDDIVKRAQAKAIVIAAIIGVLIILIGLQLANTLVTGTDVLTITCP